MLTNAPAGACRLPGQTLGIALLAAIAMLAALAAPATAVPLQKFKVDVAFYGVGAISEHVRRIFPGKLAAALQAHPIEGFPPGSTLVVRLTTIFLSQNDDPSLAKPVDFGRNASPDSVEGEARILDAKGAVLARKSLIANYSATNFRDHRFADSEPRRVEDLMDALAYWAVRAF